MQPYSSSATWPEGHLLANGSDFPYDAGWESPRLLFSRPALGGIVAIGATLLGAALWACTACLLTIHIGYMALGLGWFVGWATRKACPQPAIPLRLVACLATLWGCFAALVSTSAYLYALEAGLAPLNVVLTFLSPDMFWTGLQLSFEPIDVILYAGACIACYNTCSASPVVPVARPAAC